MARGRLAAMENRILYLAAYDIAEPERLVEGLRILRNYATGGQKSVFECFLTRAEKSLLIAQMDDLIDPEQDRFLLLRLSRRRNVRVLGLGRKPKQPRYFYLG